MKTVVVKLKSASPYSQRRAYERDVPREDRETHENYEKRTWRNGMHTDAKGEILIPANSLKNCLSEAAKYLGMQIPGKGKATYTKHFEAGVMVTEAIMLGIKRDDVPGKWLHLPADGRRGGSKRVWKCFGVIEEWEATVTIYVLDDAITKDVFTKHLEEAGKFIGLGFFRPRNNGFWGRFEVVDVQWPKD